MTLKEAFIFKAGDGISDTDAVSVLDFAGLDPNSIWDADSSQRCAFYDALLGYLESNNVGVSSESEGGYSKSYDTVGKGKYLSNLANESGCSALIDKYNQQPKVQDKSYLW